MLRAVLDPGVLIAALLSRKGAPAQLLQAWVDGQFEMVVSPNLLDELDRVLRRPRFRSYVSVADVDDYVDGLRRLATVLADPSPTPCVAPDPNDDYLVALAQAAKVHYLVSGDTHLTRLAMRPPVLSPRAFLGLLESTPSQR